MNKTNAVRLLDSQKIAYKPFEYEVDESDLSGTFVSRKIGADEDSVFKTLITRNDKNEIFVFCVPVSQELNLKKAACESGRKNSN